MRLLIDQNFDHDILRGLERRIPNLDAVTAHEEGLSEVSDPELLLWAADAGRILLTHDLRTIYPAMPESASRQVRKCLACSSSHAACPSTR